MGLRERWRTPQQYTLGGWCAIPSPVTAELMSRLGFDWLCIDTQHGLIGYLEMLSMVQAIGIVGTPTLVRVARNDSGLIGRALDAGAHGVVVPMVGTPDDARGAVQACRYPPEGYRSWGPIRNTLADPEFTPAKGNEKAACVVMLETREAIEDVEAIVSVPGIDAVYLGTMDLSVSHGLAPQELVSDLKYQGLFDSVAEACERHGVVAGAHCPDASTAQRFGDRGYRMLNVDGDMRFLRRGAELVLAQMRGAGADGPTHGYA